LTKQNHLPAALLTQAYCLTATAAFATVYVIHISNTMSASEALIVLLMCVRE